MNRGSAIGKLASALLLLGGAGCASTPTSPAPQAASAAAPAPSSAVQRMVEAARQEGELWLIWGGNTLGGAEGAQRLAAQFNSRYGLNLNVQPAERADPKELDRLRTEYQAILRKQ